MKITNNDNSNLQNAFCTGYVERMYNYYDLEKVFTVKRTCQEMRGRNEVNQHIPKWLNTNEISSAGRKRCAYICQVGFLFF